MLIVASSPEMLRPIRLNWLVARFQCPAEATPPPMDTCVDDVEIVPPPATLVDAMIVTGPAVLPL